MTNRNETSVLVVGAGPAGLTTASALGRYGVDCVLVERRLEPSQHPRATVIILELGTALVGLESGPDGARATLRDDSGREQTLTAGYVVGADGAHSTVRAALGIAMQGAADLLVAVTALVRAPLWELLGNHRYGFFATSHAGEHRSFFPAGPGDLWAFGYQLAPGDRERALPSPHELTDAIRRAAGIEDLPVRIERIGSFSSAAQIADRFRSDRAFLIGDAAHRLTPRGGTGMNTAIHDGYDLGWKLGWVLRGWASAEFLASYEAERRPVAEHNVARSADPNGTRRPAAEGPRADLGGRIGHHWLARAHGRCSTLDLLGPGFTLLTGPASEDWQSAATSVAGPLPLALASLDEITARALGIRPGGALLVRPDGIPAASWSRDGGADTALERAVADIASTRRDRHNESDAA